MANGFFFFPLPSITGMFKSKKTRKVTMEQSKLTSLEHVPEEPSDPLPSVVVDHDRLKVTELKNKLTCNRLHEKCFLPLL